MSGFSHLRPPYQSPKEHLSVCDELKVSGNQLEKGCALHRVTPNLLLAYGNSAWVPELRNPA